MIKLVKEYSKNDKSSKNVIRKYLLHGGRFQDKTNEKSMDNIDENITSEKKNNSVILNYNEDTDLISKLVCSSAIFSINSYIFDSIKNQKELYNNLYKIYIFNSINNDQVTVDKILEICNTKFTINNIDLFDYLINDRSIYIYYQYLFIIILLEMTTGISESNITTMYDRLNFYGEVMNHPLYTLNKFIRENIKFFSEKEKNIIDSHLKLSSIFNDKILKGGGPEEKYLSKLIETVCEPRHDFGGTRSFAASHFRQNYDGIILNENIPIPELNSLSKLLVNLKKNFYIFNSILSTNIMDYLKVTTLDNESQFETKLFNRFHTIKAVSNTDVDDFGYVGGLSYFSFDKDINFSSGEFILSKWNADGKLNEKNLDNFKEVLELFMSTSNIKGYVYDTSSNMPGSSDLLEHMKSELGISKHVPIVNLWDPATASRSTFDAQLTLPYHDTTFMEQIDLTQDEHFPRRNHLISNTNLTYTVEHNKSADEEPIKLTLKYYNGTTVKDLPILLSEGLSVRLLSILINTFLEYLTAISKGDAKLLNAIFETEKKNAAKFEPSKKDASDIKITQEVYQLFVNYLKEMKLFKDPSAIKRIIQILLDFKKTGDWSLINWVDKYNEANAKNSISEQLLLLTNDKLCALKSILIGNPTLFGWNDNTFGFYQGKLRDMTAESVDSKIKTITNRYPILFDSSTKKLNSYSSILQHLRDRFSNINKRLAELDIFEIFFADEGYLSKLMVSVLQFKSEFEGLHKSLTPQERKNRENTFKKQVDKITLAFDIIESINEFLGIDITYIVKLISEIRNTIYSTVSTKLLKLPTEETEISKFLIQHTSQLDEFLAKEHSSERYVKRSIRSKSLIDQLYNDLYDKYTVDGKLNPSKFMLYDNLRNEGGAFAVHATRDILSCINEIEIYKFCYQNIPQMYSSIITNINNLDIGTQNQQNIGTLLLHSFSAKSHQSLEIHMPSNFLENNSKHTLEYISNSLENVSNLIGCLLNRANMASKKNANTEAKKIFLEYLDVSKDFYTFIDEVTDALSAKMSSTSGSSSENKLPVDKSDEPYQYEESCPETFIKVDDAVERKTSKKLLSEEHLETLGTLINDSHVEETHDSKSAEAGVGSNDKDLINSMSDKPRDPTFRRAETFLKRPVDAPGPSSSSKLRKTRTVTGYEYRSTAFTDFMVKFLFREIPESSSAELKLPTVDIANYLTEKSMREEPDFVKFHDLPDLRNFINNTKKCDSIVILKKKLEDYKYELYILESVYEQMDKYNPEEKIGMGYGTLQAKVVNTKRKIEKLNEEIKTIITEYNKGKEEKDKLGSLSDNGLLSDPIIERLNEIEKDTSDISELEEVSVGLLKQDKAEQLKAMKQLLGEFYDSSDDEEMLSDDKQMPSTSTK